MLHRIFIAVNLPENIKNKLAAYQEKWSDLPARWTKKENLHITLEFLGYLPAEEIMELCQKIREDALAKKPFFVRLNKICYGPVQKDYKKPARMVWAIGEKIQEFNIIPHITLARIKNWEFKQIEPDQRPEINEDINLNFEVNSIEIMQSRLKKSAPRFLRKN